MEEPRTVQEREAPWGTAFVLGPAAALAAGFLFWVAVEMLSAVSETLDYVLNGSAYGQDLGQLVPTTGLIFALGAGAWFTVKTGRKQGVAGSKLVLPAICTVAIPIILVVLYYIVAFAACGENCST
jgi:hypothetical protein